MKNPRPRSDTWRLHGFGGGPRTTVFPYIQGIRPSPGLPGGCFPLYHPPMSDTWMTYAEAGERLGIKPESVKRRARLKAWPKRIGNDGLARVQVPGMSDPPDHPADSPPDESPPKSTPNPPADDTREKLASAETEVRLLRERVEDLTTERDRLLTLLEARPAGFWSRLLGRN